MSDMAASGDSGIFRPATVAALLVIGLLAFVAMLVLGAYAPDMRTRGTDPSHALSNAATGYSGLVRLADATGRHPHIIRSEAEFGSENLTVITPPSGSTDISKPLAGRGPVLVILPKWDVAKDPDVSTWVRRIGLKDADDPGRMFSPGFTLEIRRHRSGGRPLVTDGGTPSDIRFTAPRPLQVIRRVNPGKDVQDEDEGSDSFLGPALEPIITDGRGGVVLGRLGGREVYVLADPDLLANRGMRQAGNARSALRLLDWMNSTGADGINFDVSFNGLGRTRSPLKLAFEPPFLAMTLAIGLLLALMGLRACGRFGPPLLRQRAIAFGKQALIDNSAALIRKAGRESRMGGRYAGTLREEAATAFAVPRTLNPAEQEAYLDRLHPANPFTRLAGAARAASDKPSLVAAARALFSWKAEVGR